jgi:FkbM family methyltransferase
MKVLTLVGRSVPFSAPEGDHYLETMSALGPVDLVPVFAACCRPGDRIIDVGANIGITAVLAGALVGPDPGRVIAIEPVPETFAHLEENIRRSGLGNVDCVMAAAAAEEGEVGLVTRAGSNFAAFVSYENVLRRYPAYDELPARAQSLDQIVEEVGLDRVDFIKIDVEGYELEVLRGARRTLAGFGPRVFLEVNHYCLNVFRRTSVVDFVDEVLGLFPRVIAVDTTFALIDLTDLSTHHVFFHENVVSGRFPNLLCGFDEQVADIAAGLARSA